MSDLRDRLEEYADGLLDEPERRDLEAALEADPVLRAELERSRKFEGLLRSIHDARAEERGIQRVLHAVEGDGAATQPRGRILKLLVAGAVAAAILATVLTQLPEMLTSPEPDGNGLAAAREVYRDAVVFGNRLGKIAAERRVGRLPRIGLSGFEVPPARLSGVVFLASLNSLGVESGDEVGEQAAELVADHFVAMRSLGEGIEAECQRSEAALGLYRELRNLAGRDVADAYYDVFRPGLANLRTALRVEPGSLAFVVAEQVDPEASERYLRSYETTRARLERRYGANKLALVLGRLAPNDRRTLRRDASQDGVGRDAVLSIRSEFYRAACEAGAGRLYVDLG